ncbi:conserved Plasmodium protein, unknown function [Plasmodium gallinaceum]|uniref:Uncharacterized protein n=1 Tax=Plasmodium gallinaceum TaxID=5849 RepID=A0A1J1GSI4_PLAGA|nr:conserved Plasmodium protein, unknown function [Plasmodium gallinaceum]CRG95423.1 conserved Plasmodium protein, unknown function [Plasmodium gallinaceum]
MNKDLKGDCLSQNCSSKISEAINKYSINTLTNSSNVELEIMKRNENKSDKTIHINDLSEVEMELKTYSSIVIDNFDTIINKDDHHDERYKYYMNKLKDNNNFKKHNKINMSDLNKNILQNIKITEEINKTKDINDLMRKIEHEEIKELISLNLKLFLIEIKKIYHTLNDFLFKEFNQNKKLSDIIKTKAHDSCEKKINKISRKQYTKINLIIKKYIILKKYYKKLCKKYKEENNMLKKIYLHNINIGQLSKEHYMKSYNINSNQNNSILIDLKKNYKKNILSNSILYKDYLNNAIFKKYILNKKDNKLIQNIIKKSQKLQLNLKKYNSRYISVYCKKPFKKWKDNIKKLKYSNNENFSYPKNCINYYDNFPTSVSIKKKKKKEDENVYELFTCDKSEIKHKNRKSLDILFKKKNLYKKNETLINLRKDNIKTDNMKESPELNKINLNNVTVRPNEKVIFDEEKLEIEEKLTKKKLRKDDILKKEEKDIIENYKKSNYKDNGKKQQERKKIFSKNEKNKSQNLEINSDKDKIVHVKKNINYFSCDSFEEKKNNLLKKKKNVCKLKHMLKNKSKLENENKNETGYENNKENNIIISCITKEDIILNKKGETNRLYQEEKILSNEKKEKTVSNKEKVDTIEKKEKADLDEIKEKVVSNKENEKKEEIVSNKEKVDSIEKKEKIDSDEKKEKVDSIEKKERIVSDEKKEKICSSKKKEKDSDEIKEKIVSIKEKENINFEEKKGKTFLDK